MVSNMKKQKNYSEPWNSHNSLLKHFQAYLVIFRDIDPDSATLKHCSFCKMLHLRYIVNLCYVLRQTSLLNGVPFVLKTRSRPNVPFVVTGSCANVHCMLTCLRAHVPTCFPCSRVLVPTCPGYLLVLRVNMPYALMYSCVNGPYELRSSGGNMFSVPCLTWLAWPRNHLKACLFYSVSSFDATSFHFHCHCCYVIDTVGKV